MQFGDMAQKAIKAMSMIPMHISLLSQSAVVTIFEHCKEDMPYIHLYRS